MHKPIFYFFMIFSFFTCFLWSCKEKQVYTIESDEYETRMEQIGKTEAKMPQKFLSVKNSDKKNLVGQTIVKGSISNNAKIAVFKDMELKLRFYSKTGVLLEEDVETIYEKLGPGESTKFKSKYFSPRGSDSVSIVVQSAKPAL